MLPYLVIVGDIESTLVQDVDECLVDITILQDGCHESAQCQNSPGLYDCSCNTGFTGRVNNSQIQIPVEIEK